MKGLKLSLMFLTATFLALGLSGAAYAFHSGGVAECEGCHSMHTPQVGGTFLLVGTDQSSACLSCHGPSSTGGYHVASDPGTGTPANFTPGGDFGWLKKTYNYSYTSGGVTTDYSEEGQTHGHNVVAVDLGYTADTENSTAPGGTFPAAQLACNSCHDPHGQYRRLQAGTIAKTGAPIKASGSYNGASNEPTATEAVGVYRLLAGAGYTKDGITFNGVPAAKVPSTYNQSEGTDQVRVAYGVATSGGHQTWGNWCATCHPSMHSTGNYVHPVDQGLGSTIAGLYGQYVKSGDMSGSAASSFLSLVPFATNSGDYTVLAGLASNTDTQLGGPGTSDQVTCVSCHRAHASGFLHALRFDQGYEFMVKAGDYIGSDNPAVGTTGRGPLQSRGRLIADWQAAYYDRPATMWASYQRVLCNKCHAKD